MPVEVIESMSALKARANGALFLESNARRAQALEHYFSRRGIIQIAVSLDEKDARKWPKLLYPYPEKLEGQIEELNEKMKGHSEKRWKWQLAHLHASTKDTVAHAQKLADPLFWKHTMKRAVDSQYRSDARTIDLQSNLVSDPKYRPMIDAFVHNPEYRQQLTETVKTSIVYKNHKGLAQNAGARKKMQMDVSQSLVDKTDEQVRDAREQVDALKELLNWSKEK